jgi:hypothetical protein
MVEGRSQSHSLTFSRRRGYDFTMLDRIRRKRLLVSACSLPAGAAHLILVVLSIFLHSPGDAERATYRLGGEDFHTHDFQLRTSAGARASEPGHCPGCTVERSFTGFWSTALVTEQADRHDGESPVSDRLPHTLSHRSPLSRAPPRS